MTRTRARNSIALLISSHLGLSLGHLPPNLVMVAVPFVGLYSSYCLSLAGMGDDHESVPKSLHVFVGVLAQRLWHGM